MQRPDNEGNSMSGIEVPPVRVVVQVSTTPDPATPAIANLTRDRTIKYAGLVAAAVMPQFEGSLRVTIEISDGTLVPDEDDIRRLFKVIVPAGITIYPNATLPPCHPGTVVVVTRADYIRSAEQA
jgi:hypothetical protein